MNDRFERDLERMLAAGGEQVSPATRRELERRRREVLDAAARDPRAGWLSGLTRRLRKRSVTSQPAVRSLWLPAAGAVAAALIAVVTIRPGTESMPAIAGSDEATDMEMLLAEENLDLYEDLEFFEWLVVVEDEQG